LEVVWIGWNFGAALNGESSERGECDMLTPVIEGLSIGLFERRTCSSRVHERPKCRPDGQSSALNSCEWDMAGVTWFWAIEDGE
jgi:hypothetical protein